MMDRQFPSPPAPPSTSRFKSLLSPTSASSPGDVTSSSRSFWSDGRSATTKNANPAQYTFYREGTPPPPEVDDYDYGSEKRFVTAGGGGGGRGDSVVLAHPLPLPVVLGGSSRDGNFAGVGVGGGGGGGGMEGRGRDAHGNLNGNGDDGDQRGGRRSGYWCGVRRKIAIIILVVVVVLLVVAVAVGAGIGVSRSRADGSGKAEGSGSGSGSGQQSSSTSPTNTSSRSSSSPSKTSSPSSSPTTTGRTDCPAANNTLYASKSGSKTFLRLCGIDFSGAAGAGGGGGGATDLLHFPASNMNECMDQCADRNGCTGCGWGIIAGDGGQHQCYLKTALKQSSKAGDEDWCFAVLQ